MKSVIEILKEIRPEFDFAASGDFIADGMLDSFDVVTLVAALDKNFNISIQGTDILCRKTLKTLKQSTRFCIKAG
jgi:acyl carrier protein